MTHIADPRRHATPGRPARVVLVGYEDQDNLGLRYLSSALRHAGHEVRLVTVAGGPHEVVRAAAGWADVVGYSLIFQYLVPEFATLVRALRQAGVDAHVTMGGHYASFRPEALFRRIPQLDSIVRFEGEDTIVELAERVASGDDWRGVAGVAINDGAGGALFSPERHGRDDLDTLPWPDRDDIDYGRLRYPTASIIGGHGCPWKCSFCSIITFYDGNGTKGRRRRDPALVVDEIEYLARERGVRVVLWQDDDFLAGGRPAVRWAHEVAAGCIARGLHHDLRWKISCRSDECKHEVLAPLVEAGLTHVYLGVEAGDEDDLRNLNKLLHADAHLRAGEVLRRLGLSFDFGFMLMNPWSTLDTVRNNLDFLRAFVGDGASPVGFCRMLPYVGTGVEERLIAEARLDEHDVEADYRFLDERLDALYAWIIETFAERNHTVYGTSNLLRLLLFEAALDLPERPADRRMRAQVEALAAVDNALVCDTIEAALDRVAEVGPVGLDDDVLAMLTRHHQAEDDRLRLDLARLVASRPDANERVHVLR